MEVTHCPNCGTKIEPKGFFSTNEAYTKDKNKDSAKIIEFINVFSEKSNDSYCGNCINNMYADSKWKYNGEKSEIRLKQRESIDYIMCVSIDTPNKWDFETIGIVTAQCTMGTGLLSELSSDWNDLFGLESRTMNKKVLKAEETCLNMLRVKALNLGGNAVVGVDVDYAEVGSLRGMILVCMTGTAVRIKNTEILPEEMQENIDKLEETVIQLKKLNKYSFVETTYV